ncbi:MAG: hypothetical protein GY838_02490 [bacterium]|nr:hypothetical protein [bacterium]
MFRSHQHPVNRTRLLVSIVALAALFAATPYVMNPATTAVPDMTPTDVDADWWARISSDLAAREYHASPLGDGFQAPNRRHGLRTVFQADGIRITRRGTTPDWSWNWSLASWGRDEQIAADPVQPRAEGARVSYERPGLSEWYENREDGLEQGFEIASAPAGTGELRLEGRVETDLRARVSRDRGVVFENEDGMAALDYAELHVWDATGRELPARMDWNDGALALAVDDRDAVYPVTVDPIVTTPSWTEEGSQINADFGFSVATAGDVNGDGFSDVIIGSPDYSLTGFIVHGRAWVYLGSASGLASSPAWFDDGDGDDADFGYDVACAGDVNGDGYDDVIVGSPGWIDDLAQDGRAYVYHGSASGLSTSPDWDDNDGNYNSYRYGHSVGTAGDVNGDGYDDIVIGDPWAPATSGYGRVNVWYGSATGLGYSPSWRATGPTGDPSHLGRSVSTAGDIDGDGYDDIVAGAIYADSGGWDRGAIYVYNGSATGLPATHDQMIAGDVNYLRMGEAVSLAGDVNGDGYGDVVVGCPTDNDFCTEEPHIRLYAGSASGLSTTPDWSYGAYLAEPSIGYHVACGGDVNGDGYAEIVMGYYGYGTNEGRLMLFYGSPTGPGTVYNWWANGDQDNAWLAACGTAGDVNGDGYSDIIGGAPYYDGASSSCGLVSVWYGGPDRMAGSAAWVTESNQASAVYGYSVANAGDVNGDGFDDILVGAPYYDNGQSDEGAVFLYLGSHLGPAALPAWWAESNQENSLFGYDVAGAGDVNGDGLMDLMAGAPEYETGSYDGEGSAFVWHSVLGGGPYGNPANADWRCYSKQAGAWMGCSVAGAGDVNGDGYADVVVGAPLYDNGTANEGMIFVYHGSDDGLSGNPAWTHDTNKEDCRYGWSVDTAGDVNGDGYSDVIVGAPYYDHPDDREGLAFIYTGSASGMSTGAPWWYGQGDQASAHFGFCVSTAGDVNADGYSDWIIGVPDWDDMAIDQGIALVWYGGATAPVSGTPANAPWNAVFEAENAGIGGAVSEGGDVNADGYSDVLIGGPGVDYSGMNSSGRAEVWLGSSTGLATDYTHWFAGGTNAGAQFGNALAAGDFNGDGFGDVLIGAPYHDQGEVNEGRAYIYWGNGRRGMSRTPRMWQHDQTTRLAPLGLTSLGTEFCVGARGRMPGGRGNVRLEVECEEFGTTFDGSGLVRGDWTDTGAPSGAPGSYVDLVEPVTGLTIDTGYHWRMRLASTSPYFPRSPWLGLSWNGASELDLRTGTAASAVGDTPGPLARGLVASPNPFNPTTEFSWTLGESQAVHLKIFDARGRLVRNLVAGHRSAGPGIAVWDGRDDAGRDLASGIYLARLRTGSATRLTKVTLMK